MQKAISQRRRGRCGNHTGLQEPQNSTVFAKEGVSELPKFTPLHQSSPTPSQGSSFLFSMQLLREGL